MSASRVLDLSSGVRSAETLKDLSRWHGKKEVVYDLYIYQGKTLEDVKSIMETDHGFPKTLKHSDYEHVLREEFKYRKYLSADDWRFSVGPRIARRKAQGKLSEVTLNGSKVSNVDRKIRRSLQSKRSHRRANANAVLPHGVVIRTPSPQPSTFVAPPTFARNRTANEIERHQRYQSTMDYLTDSPFAANSELLSLLTGVMPLSDTGSGATMLSAQLLREGCPINKPLAILDKYYQRVLNPTDLRLFGANATIDILGKMCFDFSNGLYGETVSSSELSSILDWIGFSVDIASLEAFLAQKALTTLAVRDGLNVIVREWRHLAAFDVLLTIHLSITDQAPWIKTTGKQFYDFPSIVELAPTRAVTLLDAYPCDQQELDEALQDAVEYDLALLEILLEAGAVVDELSSDDDLGWLIPDGPYLATDYLLLSEHFTRNYGLWALVSPYSDRQETTITVPGIFKAAQWGQDQLRSYLNSRLKPSGDQLRQEVLKIALSEASGRGLVNVVQSLVQFGVDPNIRMLPLVPPYLCTMGTGPYHENRKIWHPVIRALNGGESDTVRILAVSTIDKALLDERVGEQLNLCALRNMTNPQRHQFLQVLSTLGLSEVSRSKILLRAVEPHRYPLRCHDGPDFGFVSELLEFGLASLDRPQHLYGETAHVLVRAIERQCGIGALSYLIERDVEALSALSATTIGALLGATLQRAVGCQKILELLSQNVGGLESYAREHSSSLLLHFLENKSRYFRISRPAQDWQEDCEAMATVKWFVDLGAPLKGLDLAKLVSNANDSFMLAIIRNVADVDAIKNCDALPEAIRLGRLNLAVSLIEKGAEVNKRDHQLKLTPLQLACENGAPFWFIRFLVDKGADVNAPPASNGGRTALQTACYNGAQLSCIRFLIEKGADVNAPPHPNNGFTALQWAAIKGFMNVAGLLLDHRADVNAISGFAVRWPLGFFHRAIDLAAQNFRLDMVHFLIAAGARSFQPGRTGFDGAIEIATRENKFAIARLLQEHADSRSGDPLEAERKWLRENPHACLYNGRIQNAGWVAFVKREGQGNAKFDKYLKEELGL